MAHSHDRTLLASLAFADKDKKDPRHDLACRYVALAENLLPVVQRVGWWSETFRAGTVSAVKDSRYKGETYADEFEGTPSGAESARLTWVGFEVAISKGSGQYRTTIGFLDAVLDLQVGLRATGRRFFFESVEKEKPGSLTVIAHALAQGRPVPPPERWTESERMEAPAEEVRELPQRVYVEVKIGEVSAADCLRQLNLYRQYEPEADRYRRSPYWTHRWLLVTAFPLSAGDVEMLRSQGVAHLKLGEKFEAFVAKELATAKVSPNEEI